MEERIKMLDTNITGVCVHDKESDREIHVFIDDGEIMIVDDPCIEAAKVKSHMLVEALCKLGIISEERKK